MLSSHRLVMALAIAPGLSAQFFADHPRSMYSDSLAGGNRVVIDVDGDGALDLLTGGTQLRYYRNDGTCNFAFVAASSFQANQVLPQSVGDYTGDGRDDYCVGGNLIRNLGNGTFALDPFSVYTFAVTPSAFADYDGDGDLDWFVSTGSLRLFANNGTGTFTEVTATVLAGFDLGVQEFRVVDLEGDGDPDIVKVGGGFGPLAAYVWRNQGLGQFTAEVLPVPSPSMGAMSQLRVADFDGDGQCDVAVVAPIFPSPGASTWCWLVSGGTGAWSLAPMSLPLVGGDFVTMDAGDWNGDGRADWVGRTGVWEQTTPLQFVFQPFAGVTLNTHVLLVDLDDDGRLDALAHGGVGWIRNRASGPVFSERAFVTGGAANPTMSQARRRVGGSHVDVVTLPALRLGSDVEQPGDADRTLRMLPDGWATGSDAALVAPPTATEAPGLMVCGGLRFYQVANGALVQATAPTLPAAPARVAAADLDGQPGDEIVFGASQFAGPMIVNRTASGWVVATPSLPAAPTSTAMTFELVLLVDFEGDGDRDIVHEHRVLRNDNGTWTALASFGALVPSTARTIAALDANLDGIQDLFVAAFAAGASKLLLGTPGGYVDGSALWLPTTPLAAMDRATTGDVDADGMVDILCVIAGRSHLLRTTGSGLVAVGDVGPAGALADLNHDDRPDLFLGDKVWWNRHTLLSAGGPAFPGNWRITLETKRSVLPVVFATVALGHAETMLPLPGIGTVYVDPTNMVLVDLPLVTGTGSLDVPIPASPAVIGTNLRAQALTFDLGQLHLSNVVRDRVR